MPDSTPSLLARDLYGHGRQFHGGIVCGLREFEAAIASCLERGAEPSEVHAHAADLFLVCAFMSGDAAARAELEDAYLRDLDRTIARVDPSEAFVTDVKRRVRTELLGESPYLSEYIGRAPLGAWIRVFALRTALACAPGSSVTAGLFDGDAELEKLCSGDRDRLRHAVMDAVALLDARGRTVLRLHQIDRLRIDEIARLYRVERTTAMAWLDTARRGVRARVIATLGVEETLAARVRTRLSSTAIWQLALSSTIVAR